MRGGILIYGLLSEFFVSFLSPAFPAINWSVRRWFKGKFGYFQTAISTFPIPLKHFSWGEVSAPIKFLEHNEIKLQLKKRPFPTLSRSTYFGSLIFEHSSSPFGLGLTICFGILIPKQ